jgi:hypothetical protein
MKARKITERKERMKEKGRIRKFATASPRTQAGRLSVGGIDVRGLRSASRTDSSCGEFDGRIRA